MSEGFAAPKVPTYWIQIVYADERERFIPCYGDVAKVMVKARNIVRDTHPPVDCVFVIDGKADITNVSGDLILAHLEPRPFNNIDGEARLVPKFGKVNYQA